MISPLGFCPVGLVRRVVVRCLVVALLAGWTAAAAAQQERYSALLIDGQNNHGNWPDTSRMMKQYLEETGLFEVTTATTAAEGTDRNFAPEFDDHDVVISNYNGAAWPPATQHAFVEYMKNGGGLIVVHAADNAFPKWQEYNDMIGVGGWGGRNETDGPRLYFDEARQTIVRDESAGRGGSHGRQHPFRVIVRDGDHPVTRGMPGAWMHANDELYDRLRGPAENMTVLATAWSDPDTGGTGQHEPILMTIDYDQGRVFHLPLGHGNDSQQCVGFIVTLQRAAEWAASGEVTQAIPDDFPGMDQVRSRPFAADTGSGR